MNESRIDDEHIDEALKQRFHGLRAMTEQPGRLPEFGAMLARTETLSAERPSLEVVAGGAARARPRWVVVGAWGSAALAATVASLLLVERGPSADEEFERLVASYATDVAASAWRSPTSGLLDVPGMQLVRSVPTIGTGLPTFDPSLDPSQAPPLPTPGTREDA